MRELSLEELDAQIALKKGELAELKRRRRKIVAGKASGKAREHSPKVQALREKYLKEDGEYGTIRRLAREVGMSERHANRVLQDLKADRRHRRRYPSSATEAPPD